jgi:hypothetical protein
LEKLRNEREDGALPGVWKTGPFDSHFGKRGERFGFFFRDYRKKNDFRGLINFA